MAPEGVLDIFAAAGLTKPDISILSDVIKVVGKSGQISLGKSYRAKRSVSSVARMARSSSRPWRWSQRASSGRFRNLIAPESSAGLPGPQRRRSLKRTPTIS